MSVPPPPCGNCDSLFTSTCFWQSDEALPYSVQGQKIVGTFILDTKGSVCTASMFWNNQKDSEKRENSRIWLMAKDNSKENWKTSKMIQKAVKVPRLQTDRGWKHTQGKYYLLFPFFWCFLLATETWYGLRRPLIRCSEDVLLFLWLMRDSSSRKSRKETAN